MDAMTPDRKLADLDAILARAADVLGDITAPVMARFYRDYPDARDSFEAHSLGDRERLEAEMVGTLLYSLMTWLERPTEIEIILTHTVPYHQQTLKVAPAAFRGLVEATDHVIADTIPADAISERATWAEITGGLQAAIVAAGLDATRAAP